MRARNIKPGFYKNEVLADCDPLARILFSGLWCLADREGRLEYRPKRIKAEILPYDDCNILKLLDQLNMRGFIVVYKVDDEIFVEIPAFSGHQNPNVKEAASVIPALYEHSESTVLVSPLTPYPLPLTENPLPFPPRRAPKRVSGSLNRFDEFWKSYPKKKAKGDAEKAWIKLNPSEHLIESILSAVQRATTSDDWTKEDGRYIPHPATWLNKKCWEDEYTSTGGFNGSNGRAGSGQSGTQAGTGRGETKYPVDISE